MTTLQSVPESLYLPGQGLYSVADFFWEAGKGLYQKRVLIILFEDDPGAVADPLFLSRIMAAVGIDLDAHCFLTKKGKGVRIFPTRNDMKPEKVLVFGPDPADLGLSIRIPLYQPAAFYGCTWLFSESLHTLQPDKNRKTLLWQALKGVFVA